jgi:two-component system, LytTR family, response regulator
MNRFKAIIVDDERLARVNLRKLLEKHSEIEIVGEAATCLSARELIHLFNPQLIFLDIQLCGETGFDVLEYAEASTKIVFVTAYDEYAIRAFDINAVDYLLKPVNPERLKVSVDRILSENTKKPDSGKGFEYTDRIYVKLNNLNYRFINISSITFIEPVGNYSRAYTCDGRHFVILKTLKQWLEELPAKNFVRIHRSSIVNINYIDRIEKKSNLPEMAYLKNFPAPLEVSRRYARQLKYLS